MGLLYSAAYAGQHYVPPPNGRCCELLPAERAALTAWGRDAVVLHQTTGHMAAHISVSRLLHVHNQYRHHNSEDCVRAHVAKHLTLDRAFTSWLAGPHFLQASYEGWATAAAMTAVPSVVDDAFSAGLASLLQAHGRLLDTWCAARLTNSSWALGLVPHVKHMRAPDLCRQLQERANVVRGLLFDSPVGGAQSDESPVTQAVLWYGAATLLRTALQTADYVTSATLRSAVYDYLCAPVDSVAAAMHAHAQHVYAAMDLG